MNVATPQTPMPTVVGSFDYVHEEHAHGWAYSPRQPNQRLAVEIVSEGRVVAYCIAGLHRNDLDQALLTRGNHGMAHRTGFTAERLGTKLAEAGFGEVRVVKGRSFDLWAVALNDAASNQAAQQTQSLNCPQERRA